MATREAGSDNRVVSVEWEGEKAAPTRVVLHPPTVEQYRELLERRRRLQRRDLLLELLLGVAAVAAITLTMGITVKVGVPTPGFGAIAALIGAVVGGLLVIASALATLQWRRRRHLNDEEVELEVLRRVYQDLSARRELIAQSDVPVASQEERPS